MSKVVPWEPFKAATSAHTRGTPPSVLPALIKYDIAKPDPTVSKHITDLEAVEENVLATETGMGGKTNDCSRMRPVGDGKEESPSAGAKATVEKQRSTDVCEDIGRLKKELELERQLTEELKRLLVATMGDDLTCHVQSLSEDKVRLAHTMTKFEAQLTEDHDRAQNLEISADMWRCKFLAMSIRADELRGQRCRLLAHCKQLRTLLNKFVTAFQNRLPSPSLGALIGETQVALGTDLSTFFERSPCDERIQKPAPLTSNITITCCRHCEGNEIKLI